LLPTNQIYSVGFEIFTNKAKCIDDASRKEVLKITYFFVGLHIMTLPFFSSPSLDLPPPPPIKFLLGKNNLFH
jgi:hypothetical protein